MNKIITTFVSDPTIEQPFTASSLDFLQDANKNIFAGIARALAGDEIYAQFTVLQGLVAYGTGNYTDGYVYLSGEIFYCAGKSNNVAFVNVPVLTTTITNDPTADPLTFTDGNARNVHNVRNLVLSDAVSGSGTIDLSDLYYIQTLDKQWVTPTYLNSWIASTVSEGTKYSLTKNKVVFKGGMKRATESAATMFTVGAAYVPTVTRHVPCTILVGAVYIPATLIIAASTGNVSVAHNAGSGVDITYLFMDGTGYYID